MTQNVKEPLAWINGEILPASQAKISIFDHSFIYGDGVFEGIKVFQGRIFHLKRHIQRLFASARFIKIDIPCSEEEVCETIVELVRKSEMPDGYVRPIVTRGEGPLGLRNMEQISRPNVLVICQRDPAKSEADLMAKGLRAKTVSTRRTPPVSLDPRVKACQYLNNILADLERRAAGADFGLMLDIEGYVCEGPGENVFIVKDGGLMTPFATKCLNGITRQDVIAAAKQANWPVVETNITLYDVYVADEFFSTGSMNEVQWIKDLDDRQIGKGEAGFISRKVLKLLREEGFRTGTRVF